MTEFLIAHGLWLVLFHFCTHEIPVVGLAVYGIYRYFHPKSKVCPGHSQEEIEEARDKIVDILFENFTIHEGACEKSLSNEEISCSSRFLGGRSDAWEDHLQNWDKTAPTVASREEKAE